MLIFMLGLPFAIIQGKNLMNSINIEYNMKYINIIYIIMMMVMMVIIMMRSMMMSRKDWNNDDNDINICHSLSIVLYYDDEVLSIMMMNDNEVFSIMMMKYFR